jgi:threonine dehydrogenase-like Zn-dependent dehydrogenase
MFATNDFSDKFPVSWNKKPTSLPLTPPPETITSAQWLNTIHSCQIDKSSPAAHAPVVAVIGVGYVGTHLVEAFAHHYNVVAYDLSEKRLRDVAEQLVDLPIQFTSCASDLTRASHVLISVPTVLNKDKTIDTTYLRSAIATVEKYVKDGSTVVVESSVAVGMTRQLVGPLMISKKLKIGMSPEVSYLEFHTSSLNLRLIRYRESTLGA